MSKKRSYFFKKVSNLIRRLQIIKARRKGNRDGLQANKIVVDNFFGRGYGDNPKYIVEQLLKMNLDFDIVWIVDEQSAQGYFPEGIRLVKVHTPQEAYEYSTAKVWIDNVKNHYKGNKQPGQFYLQTWHGSVSLKKVEKAVGSALPTSYVEASKIDSSMIDAMISNSSWQTNDYQNNFWYGGPVYEFGVPRNDIFFNQPNKTVKKVKDSLGINKDYQIILYAPTFRNFKTIEEQKKLYSLNSKLIIKACEEKFGQKFILVERFHPAVASKMDITETGMLKNGNNYPDMQELLVATDILITDFSSSMFDFILKGNRVFLYTNDYEDYINNERALNFDIKRDIPFSFANTEEELIMNIKSYDEANESEKVNEMKEKLGISDDGHASERIAHLIVKQMERS